MFNATKYAIIIADIVMIIIDMIMTINVITIIFTIIADIVMIIIDMIIIINVITIIFTIIADNHDHY